MGDTGGRHYGQGHGGNKPYMNKGAVHRPHHPRLPFLTTLNLLDLSRLTNDPVAHDPAWLAVPKLPLDIPKFEGKPGEDPSEHVTMFHLWCSSNSLHQDSIHLRLFQRTLTGPATKWYIELPRGAFALFDDLAMTFLTTSRYQCVMTLVLNSCQHFGKIHPPIFLIIFRSGVDGRD